MYFELYPHPDLVKRCHILKCLDISCHILWQSPSTRPVTNDDDDHDDDNGDNIDNEDDDYDDSDGEPDQTRPDQREREMSRMMLMMLILMMLMMMGEKRREPQPRPFPKTKLPSKMTYALHSLALRHSNYRENSRHLCLRMGMSSASIGKTYLGASWKEHTAMRKNWMCHCTACKQLITGQHSKTKNTTT